MPSIVFTLRVTLYTLLLLFVSFLAIFIAIISTLIGKRLSVNYYVARTFWHITGPLMGWKFEVQGEEHLWNVDIGDQAGSASKGGRSAVMVGNHQSFVDILYLGRIFPPHAAIMAKSSIRWLPGLGQWMMMSGTVFINRSNNKSAIASMTQAGEDMKRKRISLWIFPEGTRHLSPTPDLLSFKKGAFYLAVQSGTPIVPVVCQSYHHLYDAKTRFKSGTLQIRVLPPISTTGMTATDVPALIDQTRNAMLQTLQEMATGLSHTPSDASPTPLLTERIHSAGETREYGSTEGLRSSSQPALSMSGKVVDSGGESKSVENKLSIAMISDFFHPVVGGVEGHIYSLGVELMRRGHRVIVITHYHPPRVGIRYLSPGLKVYHLPFVPIASSATLPNFLLFLPYLRDILIREKIDLVHGHGSLSSLAHEAMLHSPLMGVRTVFTDHSLFGFGDAVGVLTNKLLAGALRNVDGVICVSNTGRENTVLRAQLDPSLVSVIPNALVAERFRPAPEPPDSTYITIVVISRLVYRKGIDLLVAAAPTICALFPEVRFLVGGDGPKMLELLQMRENHLLQDRITLLGSIPPSQVRDILIKGQIYLNTSLTEAFGISIIEAASAGLFVVSTRVGGVPEILPGDMIEFAHADEDDVVRALTKAIEVVKTGNHDPKKAHERVRDMYSWADVAERTEVVYDRAMLSPPKDTGERLARLLSLGPLFGPIMCIIIAVEHIFFEALKMWHPDDKIDFVRPWNMKEPTSTHTVE
ncbi:phosphatidylinositol glycan, class A [Tremella mesenterica]|uniref:1-acyl-sn-glycerol-3-phosphate acyltransferase n=1 Tax=Tremella mesenterica TaxID=5217 RepID=A0A4Q1BLK2_TREME|nr:phosphatidylinositol glycan, class A [Tremella mesenterica]